MACGADLANMPATLDRQLVGHSGWVRPEMVGHLEGSESALVR